MALDSVTVPPILTPSGSGRRQIGADSNSPEFEFWMVRNPSFPQPNLLSADELFSDGFLLPLRQLNDHSSPRHRSLPAEREASESNQVKEAESAELSVSPCLTPSKRWMDIFKKSIDKKITSRPLNRTGDAEEGNGKEKDAGGACIKEKKREKKNKGTISVTNGLRASELNINIWPFTRSKSAGNDVASARPRPPPAIRKVSSAPCSRSNSAGESKSKKWPSSPSRAGVHLGRSSPVYQVRRGGGGGAGGIGRSSDAFLKNSPKGVRKDGNDVRRKMPITPGNVRGGSKAGVLSFNVPTCIGYRNHLNCESYDIDTGGMAPRDGGNGGEAVHVSNLFSFRSLFAKKIH